MIAPAGTPVEIRIADASPASSPDVYGYVDIFFRPMTLPDGTLLPLRAPAQHLNVNTSAGHDSTVGVENTIGDIFEPTLLYHVFRKGRNFTLEPGARINAITEATILVRHGVVAVETPAPLVLDEETPISSFRAMPMATPQASFKPTIQTPRPGATTAPSATLGPISPYPTPIPIFTPYR